MESPQLSGCSPESLAVPQRPYCLLKTMSRYDDWFVLSLDIGLMRSGVILWQDQLAYTFPMSTSLLKMTVFLLRQLAAQFPGLKWFNYWRVPMSGPHLCWIFTWSVGFSWGAKSSLLPSPIDHTYYPDIGWHLLSTFPRWKCWFYEGRALRCFLQTSGFAI